MDLNEALAGWTVVKVAPGDGDKISCYLVVSRGSEKKVVPVGVMTSLRSSRPRSQISTFYDFDAMLRDVVQYLTTLDNPHVNPLVPVEDPDKFMLGYSCQVSGFQWWVPVTAVHRSRWMCIMSTKEGRDRFCDALFRGEWEGYEWRNPMDRQSVVPDPPNFTGSPW